MKDYSRVYVAVPTRGQVDWNTVLALQEARDTYGLPPIHYQAGRMSVSDTRAKIVQDFLASDAEVLLSIDDDVIPHPTFPEIVQHDVDVVGCPYPMIRSLASICVPAVFEPGVNGQAQIRRDPYGQQGLQEVYAIGTGCIAIQRRVLEHPKLKHNPFMYGFDTHGILVESDDLKFCRRVRKAGFEVYCDYSRPADHMCNGVSLWNLHSAYEAALLRVQEAQRGAPRPIILG